MSYTAPQYVDTKEQAILALASTIKGEAVTGGDGSVNRALDILADVLAEQDVQVPQTDAGAILALAQYVSGGGGGSGTVEDVYLWNYNTDTLNEMRPDSVFYLSGYADGNFVNTSLEFEDAQTTYSSGGVDTTIYGVRVKAVPAGAALSIGFDGEYSADMYFNYVEAHTEKMDWSLAMTPLLPVDGLYGDGYYTVTYDG